MPVSIISRTEWGAQPWSGDPQSSGPATVSLAQRTEFYVHYDGARPISRTGYAIPRAVETAHLAQGWAGIGYSFVVDQAGNVYEGRGWDRQGAHCPGHNVSAFGVQIAIGGDQEPTPAALAACRALYDEACRRTGRVLAQRGHRDGIATLCPGARLYAWVQAGMPAPDAEPRTGGSSGGTAPTDSTHTVRARDTLTAIAQKHSTTVETLAKLNGLKNPNRLTIGQVLKLPGKPSTPTAPKMTAPRFPGRDKFRPGATNRHVTQLGQQLVKKGYGRFYRVGPGPTWGEADRRNVEAFQRAQGWRGSDADGYPGPETWRRLFT